MLAEKLSPAISGIFCGFFPSMCFKMYDNAQKCVLGILCFVDGDVASQLLFFSYHLVTA